MKTISLRAFRDSIPDLREPVQVTRRSPEGEYVVLGTWEPATDEHAFVHPSFGVAELREHWDPSIMDPPPPPVRFGRSAPAPKR